MSVATDVRQRANRVRAHSSRWVYSWAGIGAVFLAVPVYLWAAWLLSGDAHHVGTGPTHVPTYVGVDASVQQVVGVIGLVAVLYWFLARPWRRLGHVTWDGLFLVAICLTYWQDLLLDYRRYAFVYNAAFINFGSWSNFVPGWMPPHGNRLVAPIVFAGTWYSFGIFGFVLLNNYAVRRIRERWPSVRRLGVFGLAFLISFVVDIPMEQLYMRLGIYAVPSVIKGPWVLFQGRSYQLPLYECIMWSAVWASWASLRYFRDSSGASTVERGIDQAELSPRRKTAVRFLALLAATNLIYLAVFNVPYAVLNGWGSPWARSVQDKSYFVQGLCGPHTRYVCQS